MRKTIILTLLIFYITIATAQKVAVVDFENENEQDVINYVLQYDNNGWQDIKTIYKGQDYTFEIPFKPGLYRLRVHQKSIDYYTKVVRLKADEMDLSVEVRDQIILHITSPKLQEVKIVLYDYTGRIILNQESSLSLDDNTIYLPKPSNGIYVINIIGNYSNIHSEISIR